MNSDDDGGWETNLSSWKQRRKSHSKYQHVQSLVEEELDTVARKPKTFKEMMQTSEQKNRSTVGYADSVDYDSAAGNVFTADDELSSDGISTQDQRNANNLHTANMAPDEAGSQRGARSNELTDKITNNGQIPNKKYCDKVIKISQRPNHEKGFGFTLSEGHELNMPVMVEKVVRGGSADVCELKSGDEIIAINGVDVASDHMSSIQNVIAQAVCAGQIELLVRRLTRHGDKDQDDEFSDEEFERANFQRLASQNYAETRWSRDLSSVQMDVDEDPPPLPSAPPPPPLDIAGVESFQDDLFPSPPPHARSTGAADQVSEFDDGTVSTRIDPEYGHDGLLRKRFEFLGLKPEDSEEYRVVQQDKKRELKPATVQSQPPVKQASDNLQLDNSDLNISTVQSTIMNKVEEAPLHANMINSQKDRGRPSQDLQSIGMRSTDKEMDENRIPLDNNNSLKYSANVIKEYRDIRPTHTADLAKKPELSHDSQSTRNVGLDLSQPQPEKEVILWNRRNSERLNSVPYEPRDELEQRKYKENYLKNAQEKIDAENEIYKREKERLLEEREQQRLQRYVVPGGRSQTLGTNSNTAVGVTKKFETQPIQHTSEKRAPNVSTSKELETVVRRDQVIENKMPSSVAYEPSRHAIAPNKGTNELRTESGGEPSSPSTWASSAVRQEAIAASAVRQEAVAASAVWQEAVALHVSGNHSSQKDFADKRYKFENIPVNSNRVTSKPSDQTSLSEKPVVAVSHPIEKLPVGESTKQASHLSERQTHGLTDREFANREYEVRHDSERRQIGNDNPKAYQYFVEQPSNQYPRTEDLIRRKHSSGDQRRLQYSEFHEPPRPQGSISSEMGGRQFTDDASNERRQLSGFSSSVDSYVSQPTSSGQSRTNRLSSAGYGDQMDVSSTGYGNQPWQRDVTPTGYINQPSRYEPSAVAYENQLPQQKYNFPKSSAYNESLLPLNYSGLPVEQNSRIPSVHQKVIESAAKLDSQYPDVYQSASASRGATADQQPTLGGGYVANQSAVDELFDNTYQTKATLRESQRSSVSALQSNRASSANDLPPQMYGARSLVDGYPMAANQKPNGTFQQQVSVREPYRPQTSGDVLGSQKIRPLSSSAVSPGAYGTQPFSSEARRTYPASPPVAVSNAIRPVDSHGPQLKSQLSMSSAESYRGQPPMSAYSLVRYGNHSPSADPRGPFKAKESPLGGSYPAQYTNFPGPLKTQLSSENNKVQPSPTSSTLPGYAMYRARTGISFEDPSGQSYGDPSLSQSYGGLSMGMPPKGRTLGGSTGHMWGPAGQDQKQMPSRPRPQLSQQFSYASQPDLQSSYIDPSRIYQSKQAEPVLHSRSSSNPAAVAPPQPGLSQSEAVNSLFAYHSHNITDTPVGLSQKTDDTNRYVPPSEAVQYISGVAQAPAKRVAPPPVATYFGQPPVSHVDYHGKYLDLTKPEQPDLYFDSNEDMYCSVCQRPLYDSLVRIIGSQLLCDNCHKTYARNLKTSQL